MLHKLKPQADVIIPYIHITYIQYYYMCISPHLSFVILATKINPYEIFSQFLNIFDNYYDKI